MMFCPPAMPLLSLRSQQPKAEFVSL